MQVERGEMNGTGKASEANAGQVWGERVEGKAVWGETVKKISVTGL